MNHFLNEYRALREASMIPPDILQYKSYRSYIRDRAEYLKKKNKNISHRYLARKMKTSVGFLQHVIEGRSNLGIDRISQVSLALKLDHFESQYLVFMVLREQTKDKITRRFFLGILLNLRLSRTSFGVVARDKIPTQYSNNILDKWLDAVIFEMLLLSDFQSDPAWILSRLAGDKDITVEDIRQSIYRLESSGLAGRRDGKLVRFVSEYIDIVPPFLPNSPIQRRGNFDKCSDVLENPAAYMPWRFATVTVAVSDDVRKQIFESFSTFINSVYSSSMVDKNRKHIVCISNVLFNPLTEND